MRRRRRVPLAVHRSTFILLLALMGCVTLSQPAPRFREYRLDYPPPPHDEGTPLPVVLRVTALRVAAIYDRDAIVYRNDSYSTATSIYTRWSANPGNMLADLLSRDLTASGRYRAIQQPPAPLASDVQLSGEVEEFEQRQREGACAAHVQLRILVSRLRATTADPVLLRTTYSEDEPCVCTDARALAAAMSRAVQRLSTQLQQDVYNAVADSVADRR